MKKGQILIAVLIIFAILSIVVLTLITILEDNLRSVQTQKAEKQALYVAEAGVEIFIYSLRYMNLSTNIYTNTGIIYGANFSGTFTATLKWDSTYSEFSIISEGSVAPMRRSLRVEGSKDATGSLTITLWQEE